MQIEKLSKLAPLFSIARHIEVEDARLLSEERAPSFAFLKLHTKCYNEGVVAGNMAEKTADTEAPKDEDRGLIHETMMLADWPRLPPLQGKAKRFVRHRARAPEGQDALHALKHRYVVVRHLAHS